MEDIRDLESLAREVSSVIGTQDPPDPARIKELVARIVQFQLLANPQLAGWSNSAASTPGAGGPVGIPVAAFKELAVTTLPKNSRQFWFESSGTTSDRKSVHYHTGRTLDLYTQSVLAWFKPHLIPESIHSHQCPKMAALTLIPSVVDAPHSSLARMTATVLDWMKPEEICQGASVDDEGNWIFDHDRIVRWLAGREEEALPVAIFGTAFAFVLLADELARRGRSHKLPSGSRVMETGGYKGRSRVVAKSELHRMITRSLGVPATHIVAEYGMCELGSQAYDHVVGKPCSVAPEERVFRFPPWAMARCLSPETLRGVGEGEVGLIEITDLVNVASSVSILTEDLGIPRSGGFQLLGRREASDRRGCSLMHA